MYPQLPVVGQFEFQVGFPSLLKKPKRHNPIRLTGMAIASADCSRVSAKKLVRIRPAIKVTPHVNKTATNEGRFLVIRTILSLSGSLPIRPRFRPDSLATIADP